MDNYEFVLGKTEQGYSYILDESSKEYIELTGRKINSPFGNKKPLFSEYAQIFNNFSNSYNKPSERITPIYVRESQFTNEELDVMKRLSARIYYEHDVNFGKTIYYPNFKKWVENDSSLSWTHNPYRLKTISDASKKETELKEAKRIAEKGLLS